MQICERSLTAITGGPTGPPALSFVRAEMLPSGYLIRPCEGGGSIIHIVDHVDLDVRIIYDLTVQLFQQSRLGSFTFQVTLRAFFSQRLGVFLKF